MRRGDIRFVDLDPAVGAEAARARPAVIVSNDGANTIAALLGRGVVTVVPVTSNLEAVHPFQVLLTATETGLRLDSKVQAEQIRSVAVERVGELMGRVPLDLLDRIDDAMRLHLGL
ncbi:MAG: type II toxin-antitoxin system PemK/MazF family toxin [Acidimicrobiaceae bacterium]|nr:type II toxin-antitoxin system PemK/MazF family toxin [Acidimicrobiaceae bacterium]MXZ97559.1 type II toxin-antitoxin system PemK/MazF family toxin [Acidimicrobiaceae bacterium]MYE75190.1 type II toxin-antitoxin system PemK/MazF family toxin [Acidimicrobiaceae bacterium]MYE96136.1 type II toxin-antitoxin system PemK/MazF family toxin [Acidimicrobiaceae bacterium]MYH43117.1 type II toxin-antitoxin system PemK/MazF family toxin [Acidimicrobiaceae bacterium]